MPSDGSLAGEWGSDAVRRRRIWLFFTPWAMRRGRQHFALSAKQQVRALMGGVQRAEPRWWLGSDYKQFGKRDAPRNLDWRQARTDDDFAARRAALTQHLVTVAFRIEAHLKWPGRSLQDLGIPSSKRSGRDEGALPRLKTMSEHEAWRVLRGRTPMTMVHVYDMSILVGRPLLLLSPWATNEADSNLLDKRTLAGRFIRWEEDDRLATEIG